MTTFTRREALGALGGAMAITGAGVGGAWAEQANYILATASTGGTYYPVGVAIATLTKVKLQPKKKIGMSAINSAGSGENVRLLAAGEAQFAILQGLFGYYAATGSGPIAEPQKNIRSVSMLWQNVEQFVIAKDAATTGTVADLAGLKGSAMALGRQSSGTIGSNKHLFGGLGYDIEKDFELFYAGYGPSADALADGQVRGISTPAGVPTGAITRLMASAGDRVAPLDFTDEQAAAADAGAELWTRYVIPAGTYPGQAADWNTIAQPNFLATNADLLEEHVYEITKAMYENLAFLNGIHAATKAMSLEKSIAGLPAPLHPGAVKYYQEAGLEIPAKLIAQ